MSKIVKITHFDCHRLVKQEDLNHHGTLFAGRMSEWFVEAGFIAVASLLPPQEIVCVKIHGLHFSSPAHSGQTIRINSRIAHLGTSSIITYVEVFAAGDTRVLVDGFLSFVHVDREHQVKAHGLQLELAGDEQRKVNERARLVQKQSREEALLS